MGVWLRIAWRYLLSKKTHNAVNIISGISLLGVVTATGALVCVLSVFNGFRSMIMGRLALLDPQVAITATVGKTMPHADSVAIAAGNTPGVRAAITVVHDQALAIFAQYQMPVHIKGVPDIYPDLNREAMEQVMVDGDFVLHDGVSTFAVLGAGPALRLNARPGYLRPLLLYAPQRRGAVNLSNPMGAFRSDSLFIAGVFQLQQNNYDADLIYVPIDVARRLLDYDPGEATTVEATLTADAHEADVMAQLQHRLGPNYIVRNRLMQQAEAYRMVNVEKWMSFLLLSFILLIATFNVISTLSLLIIEKDESIRVLRSLGATAPQVTRIFVAVGWLISLIGAVLGIAVGLLLCLGQQHYGWLKLGGDTRHLLLQAYPIEVMATDLLAVLAMVAVVGLLTSVVTTLIMHHRLRHSTVVRTP